jgi:RNA polymerase sigma-70 factor (ECF subfamily)
MASTLKPQTGKANHVSKEESDADAFARIVQGDIGALGAIYDRHYVAVLRFVQRLTRNSHDAEDLAQEVFLVAARVAATFDGRTSCRPWLFGIAARLFMHRTRRSARLRRFLERLTFQPRSASDSPQEALLRRELGGELANALAKLSPEKRVVVIMIEVEGLSCDEVAQALSIPVGTVWTRLHHARRTMRKRLDRSV